MHHILDSLTHGDTGNLKNTREPSEQTVSTSRWMETHLSVKINHYFNRNDYAPVNFGGSVALDNPQVSGARPILDTTPGGTQALMVYLVVKKMLDMLLLYIMMVEEISIILMELSKQH